MNLLASRVVFGFGLNFLQFPRRPTCFHGKNLFPRKALLSKSQRAPQPPRFSGGRGQERARTHYSCHHMNRVNCSRVAIWVQLLASWQKLQLYFFSLRLERNKEGLHSTKSILRLIQRSLSDSKLNHTRTTRLTTVNHETQRATPE